MLLGIFEFFSDMGLVLKLFVLLAIIGFLNQHMQNKTVKVLVFMLMAYIVLMGYWGLFGTIWIIYSVLGIGVSGMLVDFFFVSAQSGGEEMMQAQQQAAGTEAVQQQYTPTPAAPGAQGKSPAFRRMHR
jgi:hypothetical protein